MDNPQGLVPGQAWIDILTRPSLAAFSTAFTEDVELVGSVLAGPVVGAAGIRRVFDATRAMYDAIAFKSEFAAASRVYLEWEGLFERRAVAGLTVLGKNAVGLIAHIQLYHRPQGQAEAFAQALQRRLAARNRG